MRVRRAAGGASRLALGHQRHGHRDRRSPNQHLDAVRSRRQPERIARAEQWIQLRHQRFLYQPGQLRRRHHHHGGYDYREFRVQRRFQGLGVPERSR